MKTTKRIFWGLVLIATALFIIFKELDLITVDIGLGTIVMAIVCGAILVSSIISLSVGGVFFSLGLAWVCFGEMLGLPTISWPLALLIVILLTSGVHMVFPNLSYTKKQQKDKWKAYENVNEVGEHQSIIDQENDGYFNSGNSFGATAKYVSSDDFKGGNFKNSFGEMKVYFDNATIMSSPVTIYVDNSFGELTLFIPKDWTVKSDVRTFAANFKENNRTQQLDGPIVIIKGSVKFGEIAITYV